MHHQGRFLITRPPKYAAAAAARVAGRLLIHPAYKQRIWTNIPLMHPIKIQDL